MKAQVQDDYMDWPVPAGPICEMNYSPDQTCFQLWSPKARSVEVRLYDQGEGGDVARMSCGHIHHIFLDKNEDGTFGGVINGDLKGCFYTFVVKDENGNLLNETPGIFAKAVGVNGKRAQILDLSTTNPKGWESDVKPVLVHPQDAVIYEMHHRDFSIDASSGMLHKGKYLALTEHGTTNGQGEKTGIDHLVELGVTHVHLLPSYDYGSVDEARLDSPQYNWGYDPVNYNVPEGSYSTNPYDPAVRIREFKEMVMALHKAGIRVVMDVVYNHVFDLKNSNFEKTAPGYFFRWNNDGTPANGSGCGNETASERPMMRKFMIESVLYWVREYHIDGFRFDLMGIHDIETMTAIRRAVNSVDPSIIIYGEGWAASTPGYDANKLAMKANVHFIKGIAAFGDEMRDGLRGAWYDDKKGGFLVGIPGHEESVKFGLVGASDCGGVDLTKVNYSREFWTGEPCQMISYVSCHDDLCLADRINVTLMARRGKKKSAEAHEAECVRLQKLAYAAVFASRGIPFIWCGDEIMRDRKGVRNCYNSPDSINAIPWRLKSEHKDVYEYVKQLITLRRHLRWHEGGEYHFLPVKGSNVIAMFSSGVVIILNSNRRTITQEIPYGVWQIVSWSDRPPMPVSAGALPTFKGSSLKVPAQSALILVERS